MDRNQFIVLAGGMPKIPAPRNYLARKHQHEYFWKFFAQTKWRKSVKAIYSEMSVDTLLRRRIYSIEHIVPKSYLRSRLEQSGRPGIVIHSAIYNPYNYAPSHRKVNASRSSLPYDMDDDVLFKNVKVKKAGSLPVGTDFEGEWLVPRRSRGCVARAILYVAILYGIDHIGKDSVEKFIPWASANPPADWEIAFNRWILKKYSINNPLIEKRGGISPLSLLQDNELIRSLHAYCKHVN